MEEKSKGTCTRSTTREKEESQGSTARGDAAHLQKELQQVQQQQQQQQHQQQVQQVQQQQQAEQLGSTHSTSASSAHRSKWLRLACFAPHKRVASQKGPGFGCSARLYLAIPVQ